MKIEKAAIRQDGQFVRLFVTIDGHEYIAPVSKPVFLVQGIAALPDALADEAQTFGALAEPGNENSDEVPFEGTSDPVYVELVRLAAYDLTPRVLTVKSPEASLEAAGTWTLKNEELVKV